jgi:hypothetical protein
MENIRKKLKSEIRSVRQEVRNRTVGYIVAALGLVAGLAWNDAIRSLIEYLFPLSANSLRAKFVYAVLITLVIVFITVYLMRIAQKDEISKEKKEK